VHITVEQGALLHVGNTANDFPSINITIKAGGTVIFDTEIDPKDILALQTMKKEADASFLTAPSQGTIKKP
jgi:hypothetical protein